MAINSFQGLDMQLIEWRDDYSVGDVLMDLHHRVFFDIVRELHQGCAEGRLGVTASGAVEFLTDYVDMHFQAEERHMRDMDFSELEGHLQIHDRFRQQVASFSDHANGLRLEEVLELMQGWFLQHILREDKKYAAFGAEGERDHHDH